MIALLAKAFQADIAVISGQYARTWKACGDEQLGARPEALWVAHRGAWHYYGVLRAQGPSQQVVAASKGVSSAAVVAAVGSERPLCTPAFTCAVCSHATAGVSPLHDMGVKRRLKQKTTMQAITAEEPAPKSKAESQAKAKAKPSGQRAVPNVGKHKGEGRGSKTEVEKRRLCGNCGVRGHQAVACTSPGFACGGDHRYFECTHPELHLAARRQASSNREKWTGFGLLTGIARLVQR